jgi:hypothetical protein
VIRPRIEEFWHLVYATPAAMLAAALRVRCNAATVYVTDRAGPNPWDGLPDTSSVSWRRWGAMGR